MTIVTEYDWESDTWTHNGDNPARTAWREAVAEVAAKARQTLPECNGRVESAVKMVLAGDVELLPEGKAQVASQSNGTTQYFVVNGECPCKDYPKAPSNWCKHRIAAGMHKRATALAKQKLAQLDGVSTGQAPPDAPAAEPTWHLATTPDGVTLRPGAEPTTPPAPLPEAPASCNTYITLAGRKVQVTLRDSDEQRLLARLDALLQRFPAEAEPEGEQALPEGWCRTHSAQMKLHHGKDGSTWYSHQIGPKQWCKGK